MACMETQTAADAPIEGEFHGAFTYHFCQMLRSNGQLGSREAIEAVAQQLQGQFEQVPQHEGRELDTPIFGQAGETNNGSEAAPSVPGSCGDPAAELPADADAAADAEALTAQQMVYQAHMKFLDTMAALQGVSLPERSLRASGRVLVTVHGIGNHRAGYSNSWWQALSPHVGASFDPSDLGRGRQEVLWSDLVNRSRSLQRSLPAQEVNALRQSILDVIDDRRSHEASRSGRLDQLPVARGSAIAIDDFLVYMLDDGMRRQILERFTRVVGPLLAAGTRIDLISHSWGTVVAYEGLRELERRGLSGRVANWFTAGSALSIAPVQGRLRPENRPANGRRAPYPALVDAWINLDAKGDPVGGPLGGRFPVTREYLELDPTTCGRQFWGGYDIGCAHGSYFQVPNLRVNRDIFAGHTHLQTEFNTRKLAVLGDTWTFQPLDPKNPADIQAADAAATLLKNGSFTNPGLNHLLNAALYPVSLIRKTYTLAPPNPQPLSPVNPCCSFSRRSAALCLGREGLGRDAMRDAISLIRDAMRDAIREAP
jgi:hypothetical protein